MNARAIFDRQFAGRNFEVYSIAGDNAISKPASFNKTYDELMSIEQTGAGNGVDIREVK